MAPRIPSLNWLRVFEAAARTESFARAAAQLNMSAAAVSQQVKALEGQLGQPLFIRHAHAVTLTEAGRAYLPSVQQSLQMLESSTAGLFGAGRAEQLYVQSMLLFSTGVLARGLAGFQAAHPEVSLVLSTSVTGADFTAQYADLKIIFGNPGEYGRESDRLLGEALYPVALPGLAAAITGPADLLDHPLIEVAGHRAGWPQVFEALRLPQGAARFRYTDNTIMAAAMAAEGLGIALARGPASDRTMQGLGLQPCLAGPPVPGNQSYHLVYPDLTALRPAARKFRSWLLDYVRSLG
jgi:LysR family glycine cleavage system transcriptional activator